MKSLNLKWGFNNKTIRILLIAFLLTNLVVRVIYVTYSPDHLSWPDEKVYVKGAKEIAGFDQPLQYFSAPIKYKREPVYVFFLALIFKISPIHFLLVARIIQSLLFTLSALILFRTLSLLTSPISAFCMTLYYLFYPYYIYLGGMLLTESVYIPLLIFAVFLGIRYISEEKRIYFYLFVISLALLFLTKATALSYAPLLFFFGYMFFRKKKKILPIILALLLFLIICSPFWYRNYSLGHTYPLLSRNDPAQMSRNPWFSNTENSLATRIGQSSKMLGKNTAGFFSPLPGDIEEEGLQTSSIIKLISLIAVLPLFAALLAGLFMLGRPEVRFIYLLYLFYTIPYLIILGDTRYRLPVDFIGMIMLGVVLDHLYSFAKREQVQP